SERYNQAKALRIQSTQASSEASVMKTIDALGFQIWLVASAEGNTQLQQRYRRHFSTEFAVAFEKWLANPEADPTPLSLPEYRLASADKAAELESEADQAYAEGEIAGRREDAYDLNSVSLAFALLFAGIFQQARSRPVRVALLCVAAAFFG